ncbi:GTPase IMAP family member 8-like [Alosa pseudoharengus]|uniref:GTPase IMAP family member 8-like n=1 Tax=Alosa pseudoharengus TaxID=34774 RepID=UPI003F89FC85
MISFSHKLDHLSETAEMAAEGLSSVGSDVKIVLLGNREAGKSSAGNTILGREEFDPDVRTLQCVKRQGEVAGRQVTVVDTPGWKDYDFIFHRDSPNLLKQEIVLSVTLCPPGPHAFLLVIHENMTFTEMERNATSNHLSLLGHGAWKHSLVLFIQETPAEEKAFEVKGKMLQWLEERCGNRYHVLNIKSKDNTQVTELLEKIEEMVAGNSGRHYEINRDILQKVEEKRREKESRAEDKQKKIQRQRKPTTSLKGLRIVLLGFQNAGKSSSGNTILGREEFQPGQRSAVCVKRQGEVAGRQVTVVEAPGWLACIPLKYSSKIFKLQIVLSQNLCDQGPHSFCLVIRVDAAFTEVHKTSVQQYISLLGEGVWSHTMVLFTHGDWLGDTTIEQHMESEEALQSLVEKCGNRYHVLNNQNRDDKQVTQLLEKIEEMVAMNKSPHFKMSEDLLQNFVERANTEKIRAEKRMMKVKKQRHDVRSPLGQIRQSSLRIVLLGFKHTGKTSTGNTILGEDVFELCSTSKCEKREGEVAGRQVTVVDTPSCWWRDGMTNAPEFLKQETILSVSLCDPGPHVLLLHIRVDVCFNIQYREEVQQYLALFSGDIWSHTMVLFTCGDCLGDTTIEQHIESEEHIRYLVEKCGNRYHVINNNDGTDDQVTELLEKIEEMVAGNGGRHYEMDRKRLKQAKKSREKEEERATERLMKVERKHIQFLNTGNVYPLSEFRVVLLGQIGSGKSSSGNTILGREEFDVKRRTQCVKRQGEVAGRQVTVIEAPGWWKNINVKDTEELTKQEIVLSVSLCPPGPHAVLLVIPVNLSLSENYRSILQEHFEVLNERVWSHAMVVFTYGDWLGDTPIEQHIESEEALQSLVEKCGNRYHVLNNQNSDDKQVTQLLEKIEEMVAANGGRHFEVDTTILQEVEKKRSHLTTRVEDRETRAYRQDAMFKYVMGELQPLPGIKVMLLKYTEKQNSDRAEGVTFQCENKQEIRGGQEITELCMTPSRRNLKKTKAELLSLCDPGPHAFVLKVYTYMRFTERRRKQFQTRDVTV